MHVFLVDSFFVVDNRRLNAGAATNGTIDYWSIDYWRELWDTEEWKLCQIFLLRNFRENEAARLSKQRI